MSNDYAAVNLTCSRIIYNSINFSIQSSIYLKLTGIIIIIYNYIIKKIQMLKFKVELLFV